MLRETHGSAMLALKCFKPTSFVSTLEATTCVELFINYHSVYLFLVNAQRTCHRMDYALSLCPSRPVDSVLQQYERVEQPLSVRSGVF